MGAVGGFDAWLDELRPARASARVCARADLVAHHEQLERDLAGAIRTMGVDADDSIAEGSDYLRIVELIRILEAEMATHEQEFVFESIGDDAWDDLVRAHPPTEEDQAAGYQFDRSTFRPALLVASCVEPGLTAAQVAMMQERKMSLLHLFAAAWQANRGDNPVPKSQLATGVTRAFGASPTGS